jgi:hypothetical protein
MSDAAAPSGSAEAARKPTAKELRLLARAEAATLAAAETASRLASQGDVFGDLPLIQSREMTGRVWTRCVARSARARARVMR